jgi:hypothetical protein
MRGRVTRLAVLVFLHQWVYRGSVSREVDRTRYDDRLFKRTWGTMGRREGGKDWREDRGGTLGGKLEVGRSMMAMMT